MVERFQAIGTDEDPRMVPTTKGPWVRYSDYGRLQEQMEALEGSLVLAELDRKASLETAKSAVQESYRAAEYLDRAEAAEAERDRLRGALRIIAGLAPCIDNLMGNADIARAALQKEPQS